MTFAPSGARFRGNEVLNHLREHRALTIDVISRMMNPRMSKKKLRRALNLLQRAGVVQVRNVGNHFRFYEINPSLKARQAVAERLSCKADHLIQPMAPIRNWLHNQWCEYWIHYLRACFPASTVVRESEIPTHEIARRILLTDVSDYELLPDFLLSLPHRLEKGQVWVAVEIERTRKSNARLLRKLRKYSDRTRIDALMYICDSGRLSETIRELYSSNFAATSKRIGHYGEDFFVFSNCVDSDFAELNSLFNAAGRPVNLKHWVEQLLTTKSTLRRNTGPNEGDTRPPWQS